MTSHAERFEAARQRHLANKTLLADFARTKQFPLDHFQVEACKALESGFGVLVAAPTGAGKTIIGEFAIFLAQKQQRKAFYTTPIKALSNQKFHELIEVYGNDKVGLLTGDVSINSEADIVVMTTEVLRNMLYVQSSTLQRLGHVVMDEVHYLADRSRGAVWEEVILHLPASVSVTALSATVSNAEEFGEWLGQVRGQTQVVVEEHRPVPLWQLVAADSRIHDLFTDESATTINPELIRLHRDEMRTQKVSRNQRGRGRSYSRHTPERDELIRRLEYAELLPAIYFIFSRKGCDQAVDHAMRRGLNLTSPQEKQVIHERVEAAVRDVPGEDLAALDYSAWLHALERGVSAHHAGLIPRFKEVVEGLFQDGLLKVVFATETLALGINMPARSVVIDKLSKWNGDTHVDLTAGEFTQLTGRAGRRGIDDEGNAVVVWQSDLDPIHLAGLASTRTYPLKSSFRPGYTMAANVLSSMGFSRSLSLLESSFAQFQADAGAASLIATAKKLREGQRGYAEAMECHLGNFMNYASLRVEISDLEKQASNQGRIDLLQQTLKSVEELKRGDVIVITVGRRIGPAVVLDPGNEIEGQPRPLVLTAHREVRRLSVKDFSGEVLPVERIAIPKGFDARSSRARHELAQKLKNRAFDARPRKKSAPRSADIDASIADLRHRMKQHPCHGCTDREQHARWAERYFRTEREISGLQKQIDHRTNILARDFERVCSVMLDLRYLVKENEDYVVTEDGVTLRRLHVESELILAESLRQDIFANLTPEEFAAVISVLVFESRRDEGHAAKLPRGNAEIAIREVISIWSSLRELEARHGLATVRKPDTGFAWIIYKWARGTKLASVLQESDLSAGDFVRTTRRLVDVMEQIAAVASDDVRAIAHAACDAVQRGIITALEDDEEFAT